ncbi:MAG: isoprenylcysteine carboxylmethyltransferase family protein [Myxococcota bacterium]|jgi:protein-S-isoprenylcysteine O-methyltransferase Ste14|nr:isoprenylcysteine carboxylmethyltransferase family protein [Myxococcota bacterium]
MIKKVIHGCLVGAALLALPAFLKPAILGEAHIWILIVLGILATIYQPAYKAGEGSRTAEDRGTAVQIVWTIYLIQLAAVLEAAILRYPQSFTFDWISLLALLFMLAGLALRTISVRTLGKYFTWNVEVQENQEVIKSGPYQFVRHPSYTGAWMTYWASTFFLHSWIAAAAATLLLPLAFFRRIHHEEALLKNTFSDYAEYTKTTKALIPWLI